MISNDFITGGYYLSKKFKRPPVIAPKLPETMVTLSDCFTDLGPGPWLLREWNSDEEEVAEQASLFGIPQHLVLPMLDWCTEEKFNVHPTSFRIAETAIEFSRRFVRSSDVVILGIGLHRKLMKSLRSQLSKDVNSGYGLIEQIEREESLSPSGTALGFEPLGYEATKFHSWLCHDAPDEVESALGVGTNQKGFISELENAIRVTEHLVATGAESAMWEPWLVVQYT